MWLDIPMRYIKLVEMCHRLDNLAENLGRHTLIQHLARLLLEQILQDFAISFFCDQTDIA